MQDDYAEDRRDMTAAGVSPAFAARVFATAAMWYPTPDELLNAGYITGFAANAGVALSGLGALSR